MIDRKKEVKEIDAEFLAQYISDSVNLKSPNFDPNAIHPDLSHAIFGITTESCEFLEGLIKASDVFFADKVNLKEELGDICWYLAIAQDHYQSQGIESDIFSQANPYDVEHKEIITFTELLVTTAGELTDVVKRSYYYGKAENTPQIQDLPCLFSKVFRICVAIAPFLQTNIEDVMTSNRNKLKSRFPEKFDTEKVFNRDLPAERKILEQK